MALAINTKNYLHFGEAQKGRTRVPGKTGASSSLSSHLYIYMHAGRAASFSHRSAPRAACAEKGTDQRPRATRIWVSSLVAGAIRRFARARGNSSLTSRRALARLLLSFPFPKDASAIGVSLSPSLFFFRERQQH